jgi:hypothetical protein
VYDYCTQKKSDFMLIDIDHKDIRFRKNFTFVIDINALQRESDK